MAQIARFGGEICKDENLADFVIINSCTVTNGADSDVRNFIHRMNRAGRKVIITGCAALNKGKEFFERGEIFGVFGMSNKNRIAEFLNKGERFCELGNLNFKENALLNDFKSHTKAFIKIQEGCDFNCSYCIIPSVRGKSRSVDENLIIEEVKKIIAGNHTEIVLTGTNIGSYGKDNGSSLGELLQKLGKISGLKRIRLGSIEPSQIDEKFREILDEPWLEKHLHIALQHTSQKMLTIMRRRNKALKDLKLFNELAERGFALGTDFIVAHPGETDEIWNEALINFKKFPLTHLHAFIFSPREGTHSAGLKIETNGIEAKKRLKTLQSIIRENNLKFRKSHYNNLFVLVERKNGEFYEGYDQFYNKIFIKSSHELNRKFLEIEKYEIGNEANFAEF